MLWTVSYFSTSLIAGPSPEMARLRGECIENNTERDVTGALYFDGLHFYQCIEGRRDVIEPLFRSIARDCRHVGVTLLRAGPVPGRRFAQWSMRFVEPARMPKELARLPARALRQRCQGTIDRVEGALAAA